MSKFSGASAVKKAQEGQLSGIELPTEGEQLTTAPPPQEQPAPSRLEQKLAQAAPAAAPEPEAEVGPTEALEQEVAAEAEAQEIGRQRVPSLAERGQDTERVDRWMKPVIPSQDSAATADGGLRSRAGQMAGALSAGALTLSAKGISSARKLETEGVSGNELADAIAEKQKGSVLAALSRANAVTYDPQQDLQVPDPLYGQVASAVVENEFANVLLGQAGPAQLDFQTEGEVEAGIEGVQDTVGSQGPTPLTHATGNAKLGQTIHQEYQRMKGADTPDRLGREEAESLGAAFKHLWADQNPGLVKRFIDPETNQYTYQLTADGEAVLKNGAPDRKRLFPTKNVRPAKNPLVTGKLPGDTGATQVRDHAGVVGKPKFGKVLNQAMENLAQVPNVVDKQRAKILFSTILPVLRDGNHDSWQADIHSMGKSKLDKFAAAEFLARSKNEPYSAEDTLASYLDVTAQQVRAVAQERNGANYLSYSIQGFNGRISPQQSFFDPTTSKAVRFVTRNATPSIAKPGSRVEKNLRQMYAMMILPKAEDADAALPVVREQKLTANSARLEAWGDRLANAVAMTDEQYEAVSQAIEQGIALTDPSFPQFPGMDLDPEADAELIAHIRSKGEDGPHVIDGLIDFAKYIKAKRAGRPHNSYFNAYMDGKTNGLASNGVQLGDINTAYKTGVIRNPKNRSELLDNSQDIRDELKILALDSLDEGWPGEVSEFSTELTEVARSVYSDRDTNKMTTMTFGYGKEINSFASKMEETVSLKSKELSPDHPFHASLKTLTDTGLSFKDVGKILNEKYAPSLAGVMADDALAARAVQRAAAALHAATNMPFTISGPTGMDITLGRNQTTGYAGASSKSSYRIGGERTTVAHYETEATAAAPRVKENPDGSIEVTPGEHAYGGSVVAPVQAMDAATVGLTASGKSWDRLSQASGGNPYMHTIYDAFKVDANGYDVVLEEVNKNWLNTGMRYSYLEATKDGTKKSLADWQAKNADRSGGDIITDNEAQYMRWFLGLVKSKSSGNMYMGNMAMKMQKFKIYPEPWSQEMWDDINAMKKAMKAVGYDVNQPPEKITFTQLKTFVKTMAGQLNLSSRMDKMIERTNTNKRKLKEKILKEGYKTPSGERIALQYYAH